MKWLLRSNRALPRGNLLKNQKMNGKTRFWARFLVTVR